MINLKDYGRAHSGEIGLGLAFLIPQQHDAKIEWTIPAAGPCLVSANVSRGPSRAVTIPLEILLPDGKSRTTALAGRSSDFRRGPWQDVGVLRNPQGAKLRVKPVEGGVACVDLLRLTPLAASDLAKIGGDAALKALTGALDSEQDSTVQAAMAGLETLGDQAVPALAGVMTSQNAATISAVR